MAESEVVTPPAPPASAPAPAPEPSTVHEALDDDDDVDEDVGKVAHADMVTRALIEGKGGTYRPGSPEANVVRKLVHDKRKLIAKNAQLRTRVVGEKDVVLKGDDVSGYNELKALGFSPSQIKDKLSQLNAAQEKIKQQEQESFFSDVADGLGYVGRGKKAFLRTVKKEGIDLVMKEITVENEEGKKVKVMQPFAKLLTEGADKLRPIEEYVEQDLVDLLPAFHAADDDSFDGDAPGSGRPHAPAKKVTPMVTQSRSTGNAREAAERGVVNAVLGRRYVLPKKDGAK